MRFGNYLSELGALLTGRYSRLITADVSRIKAAADGTAGRSPPLTRPVSGHSASPLLLAEPCPQGSEHSGDEAQPAHLDCSKK
jgi:hypothetical protein